MTHFQILINQMSFNLPTGKALFDKLSLAFSKHKTGMVGRNGIGKSTLIKLILGELCPSSGSISIKGKLAYVPQHFLIARELTVAGFLGCEEKINALHRINQGSVSPHDFFILNEEWDIEERTQKQLSLFGLDNIPYHRSLEMLSGGEITRLLLVKAFLSNADFLLLDEPTNHLDRTMIKQLYAAIREWHGGLIVISHDRELLNLMDEIIELNTLGISCYGGNYNAYAAQKAIEKAAQELQLHDAKKLIQKSKQTVQASREKHEQKQSYGKALRKSGSIDKIGANSKRGRSERTQNKLSIKEERLLNQAEKQIQLAQEKIEILDEINIELPATKVPNGKIILDIQEISFTYLKIDNSIIKNFSLKLQGPERIAIMGDNGSGKTTLLKLILGELNPISGKIYIGTDHVNYLDQNASLLNADLSIIENFLRLNPSSTENDAYRSLARFLFKNISALQFVKDLSGGERLRALLACVLMSKHPPQLLILDEPTNHLDLNSIESIESVLNNYQGAMIVISHDQTFLKNIAIRKVIYAPFIN